MALWSKRYPTAPFHASAVPRLTFWSGNGGASSLTLATREGTKATHLPLARQLGVAIGQSQLVLHLSFVSVARHTCSMGAAEGSGKTNGRASISFVESELVQQEPVQDVFSPAFTPYVRAAWAPWHCVRLPTHPANTGCGSYRLLASVLGRTVGHAHVDRGDSSCKAEDRKSGRANLSARESSHHFSHRPAAGGLTKSTG